MLDLDVWKVLIPVGAAGIGAFSAWGTSFINGFFTSRGQIVAAAPTIQAAAQRAAADAQKILLDGLTTFVEKLQAERTQLLEEIRGQRDYIDALSNKVMDLSSHIDSLEREMREHGLTPPKRPTWVRHTA